MEAMPFLRMAASFASRRALARRFSSRYAVKLSPLEIRTLLSQLFASSDPNRTPGGEPVAVMLTMEKLGALFK